MNAYPILRAGLLATACLASSVAAQAAIVYSGPVELAVPEGGAAIHFDLPSGQAGVFDAPYILEGWSGCLYSSFTLTEGEDWPDQETWAGLATQPGLDTLTRSDAPVDGLLRLDAGFELNRPDDAWYTGGGGLLNSSYNGTFSNDAHWTPGSTGYVGLRLDGNLGWARVTLDAERSVTLHDFAFADAGERIVTGQTAIPEASTTALLLGLSAGGLVVVRRLRQRSKGE